MNLNDLSAAELGDIDAICLEFESALRNGDSPSIESTLDKYQRSLGEAGRPAQVQLLENELRGILDELSDVNLPKTERRDPEVTPIASPTVGPYSIGPVLARGGMGIVYRAMDTRLDRPVAIKMIGFPNVSESDPKRVEMQERFQREAKAVAALSHPNIVELFDVGVEDGIPYAVMEFLDGVTLAKHLRQGSLSADQTRNIAVQISGALTTAHAGGVIHRDLKPQNVMVLQDPDHMGGDELRVKLVDFGLSRVSASSFLGGSGSSEPTRMGTILGTPGYMAPEQARGEAVTGAADVFGLGSLLYECLVGSPAFGGMSPADRLAETLNREVAFTEEQSQQAPQLCRLIEHMLQKDVADRPTASDVYQTLRATLPPSTVSTTTLTGPPANSAPRSLLLSRRSVGVLIGVGAVATSVTMYSSMNGANQIGKVDSVAVLTFRGSETSDALDQSGAPLNGRRITNGEMMAAALVNEMSAIEGLAVRPFRPRMASEPSEYAQLGRDLEVDAFVTGEFRTEQEGENQIWVLNWNLVSADDGRVLAGDYYSEKVDGSFSDRLMRQNRVAAKIADQLDRALDGRLRSRSMPKSGAYGCLIKGKAQADVDSTKGLREALNCFAHAQVEDPNLIETLGAYAVTAIQLASRTDRREADRRVSEAISKMQEAIRKDPQAVDALLAQAMVESQIFFSFDLAFPKLKMLAEEYPYNWQVQHQYGLLLATLGKESESLNAFYRAAKLNPASVLVKIDRCRAAWFFGDAEGAIQDAQRYRSGLSKTDVSRGMLSTGLLIDIYEQQERFDLAAAEQNWETTEHDHTSYFQARKQSLEEYPYGPFGQLLNKAICDLRSDPIVEKVEVDDLSESRSPMFPLLINRHPAFQPMRNLYEEAENGAPPNYLVSRDRFSA